MTKQELEKYQHLEQQAAIIFELHQNLERQKLQLASNEMSQDMPKTSNRRLLSDVIEKLDSKAWEYYNCRLRALQQLDAIEEFIESLDNPLHQNILRLKYVQGYQWWKVARELNYSERHVKDIRDKILENCALKCII